MLPLIASTFLYCLLLPAAHASFSCILLLQSGVGAITVTAIVAAAAAAVLLLQIATLTYINVSYINLQINTEVHHSIASEHLQSLF